MDQVQCVLAGDVTYNIILIIMAQHIAPKLLAPPYCSSMFPLRSLDLTTGCVICLSIVYSHVFFTSARFFSFTLRKIFLQVGGFSALVTSAPFAPLRMDPPY